MKGDFKPRIGVNAITNLIGYGLITVVAIVCTPIFIRVIGEARYGILALVWLLFGYFGVFDFGLSRATSNRLAKTNHATPECRAQVFWTALVANLTLGIFGAVVFLVISKNLMPLYVKVSVNFIGEIERSLPWIALLVPLAIVNGVFVAALEASEDFVKLNILQIIGSTIFQILPLAAVVLIAPRIDVAIIATVMGRIIAIFIVAISAMRIIGFSNKGRPNWNIAKDLFKYGSWVTVGSVVAPLLVTIDQFVIGALISIQAVTYYSVSYSVAGRASIIPLSLSRALFPRLSKQSSDQAKTLTVKAIAFLANTTAGLYAAAIILSPMALRLWLGEEFSIHATLIMQILFVGVWMNGLAYVPFAMTQAQGRPDLVAKITLLEFIPYLVVLWILIFFFGLPGAAVAWALRAAIDMLLQMKAAGLRVGELKRLIGGAFILFLALIVTGQTNSHVGLSICLALLCLCLSGVQILRHPTVRQYSIEIMRKFKISS